MTKNKEIIAFKGFDKNLKCRGYQYNIGETYEHQGNVLACKSGFHSCINPLDVLDYYDITSRFAEVKISGDLSYHSHDSKVSSAKITIIAELKLPEFINKCVSWVINQCKSSFDIKESSSGYSAQIGSSGDYAKIGSSGNYAKIGSSGDNAQIGSSGYSAKIGSSGDNAKIGSSGDNAKINIEGELSIVSCVGTFSIIKGGKNCAMSLARWVESEKRYRITVAYVGENGIKEDTWYKLDCDGNFVEDTCNDE